MKLLRLLLFATVSLGVAASSVTCALASTATATIAVSATVLSACTISALPLGFGNYASVTLAATTTVTTACTAGASYNVGLDNGIGNSATTGVRKMTYLTNTLNYSLYTDSGHSTLWGSTIGTNTVTNTGTGLPQTTTVYGQIPGGQFVPPGLYVDTVTATITY